VRSPTEHDHHEATVFDGVEDAKSVSSVPATVLSMTVGFDGVMLCGAGLYVAGIAALRRLVPRSGTDLASGRFACSSSATRNRSDV
jgi:hypothetical protein